MNNRIVPLELGKVYGKFLDSLESPAYQKLRRAQKTTKGLLRLCEFSIYEIEKKSRFKYYRPVYDCLLNHDWEFVIESVRAIFRKNHFVLKLGVESFGLEQNQNEVNFHKDLRKGRFELPPRVEVPRLYQYHKKFYWTVVHFVEGASSGSISKDLVNWGEKIGLTDVRPSNIRRQPDGKIFIVDQGCYCG